MDESKIFDLLIEVKDKQSSMASDISAIKEHLCNLNGSVKSQKELCCRTRENLSSRINKLDNKIYLAVGGLSGIMFILAVLTYVGVI